MPSAGEHDQDRGDRVRRSYDAVAGEYRTRIGGELAHKPLDRALLGALVEETADGAPVADLGCGPGHVTGWLAARGVRAVGIDLSPRMVGLARADHPAAEFRVGDLRRLPAADGEFGAAVALYSVIHLAPDELRPAFAEMRRVLRPAAPLLVAFHLGDEVRHMARWWDHDVDVDFHFLDAADVRAAMEATGFTVRAALERTHYPHEAASRRAYVLARRAV
ncbi:class I SAM-dependent methyltransferase [Streptomyces sp. NPDC088733]|uniref:class I SAM-dependent methyltransferase n=1 Tax=Streptomyces sp. NPDC088733 TaxID=3365880 RepID=UPI00380514C9